MPSPTNAQQFSVQPALVAGVLGAASDERLVALLRLGQESAFETLASRYEVRLLSFCRHMLRSKEDAEDALQDVLAAAFRALVADERQIHVRPWLYRIAKNRCINELRRNKAVVVDSPGDHAAQNGRALVDKVVSRQQLRDLVDDVQALPETQRTALVLREFDGFAYQQIATAMDTTVPAVKSLLVRARAALRDSSVKRAAGLPTPMGPPRGDRRTQGGNPPARRTGR